MDGSIRNEDTMRFWLNNMDEFKRIRKESRPPEIVMQEFYDWTIALPQPRILAANPASFDSAFLFFYLTKYIGETAVSDLFKRSRALDIRTAISILFAEPYSSAERSLLPEEWADGNTITHNALDDARQQGAILMHLLDAAGGETSESATA